DSLGNLIWDFNTTTPQIVTPTTFLVAECTVDGDGVTPGTGIVADSYVPVACTITSAVLQATSAGSVVRDVVLNPFVVNSPPTVADIIAASDLPTHTSSQSSIGNILTGWTTSVAAGTALRFIINSIDTLTRFVLSLVASIP